MAPPGGDGEAPGMPRRYTPEHRARVVARYRRSGLTQREFAEREGIKLSALQGWLYRPAKATHASPHFVEIVSSTARLSGASRAIEIRIGEVQVVVPDDMAPGRLAALVHALVSEGREG